MAASGSPFDWASLISGVVGNFLSGASKSDQEQEQLDQQNRQFNTSQQNSLSATQGSQALAATQMDPLAQQKSREKQALVSTILSAYQPTKWDPVAKSWTGGLNLSKEQLAPALPFFSNDARAGADAAFQATAHNASPKYASPDLSSAGYGNSAGIAGFPGGNGDGTNIPNTNFLKPVYVNDGTSGQDKSSLGDYQANNTPTFTQTSAPNTPGTDTNGSDSPGIIGNLVMSGMGGTGLMALLRLLQKGKTNGTTTTPGEEK